MSSQNAKSKPIIHCEGVYKIFGENAKKLLSQSAGKVDAALFKEAGCVVGVNNASFDLYEASNFC